MLINLIFQSLKDIRFIKQSHTLKSKTGIE